MVSALSVVDHAGDSKVAGNIGIVCVRAGMREMELNEIRTSYMSFAERALWFAFLGISRLSISRHLSASNFRCTRRDDSDSGFNLDSKLFLSGGSGPAAFVVRGSSTSNPRGYVLCLVGRSAVYLCEFVLCASSAEGADLEGPRVGKGG